MKGRREDVGQLGTPAADPHTELPKGRPPRDGSRLFKPSKITYCTASREPGMERGRYRVPRGQLQRSL